LKIIKPRSLTSGRGNNGDTYAQMKQEIERAKAAGFDDEQAYEQAYKNIYGAREKTTYTPQGTVKSKQVTGTKREYGGFQNSPLGKFFKNNNR